MSKNNSLNLSPHVALRDTTQGGWLFFSKPLRTWQVHRLEDVIPTLTEIENSVNQLGLYAAGFISYEASSAFDPALITHPPDRFPLLWFGLFNPPQVQTELPKNPQTSLSQSKWDSSIDSDGYNQGFQIIKEAIARGDTYQVNFTHRLFTPLSLDPWDVFTQLVKSNDQEYAAFINLPEWGICSASPELFFRLTGDTIESKPMKGTSRRGLWSEEDLYQAKLLQNTEKERAENLMITDMVRNDLGRIARYGSVIVPDLFTVERFPTVWQMISRVTAQTDTSLVEILRALFPPASITGAPKKSTMQIIHHIENTPRHVYTGCIGMISPNRQVLFNVAIRTILIDKIRGLAEYGVGGGIVWDSDCEREQEECRIKSKVLSHVVPEFDLLETFLWRQGPGYWLLEEHLYRLAQSADYFSRPFSRCDVVNALRQAEAGLSGRQKVRLILSRTGQITIEAESIQAMQTEIPQPLAISTLPVDKNNVFLYHKTTRRDLYEAARLSQPGFADVLLFNTDGEVTESCRANVMLKVEGRLYTPPISCGLLGGTFRARLLKEKVILEKVLPLAEVKNNPYVWLFNSLRGIWPVKLVG